MGGLTCVYAHTSLGISELSVGVASMGVASIGVAGVLGVIGVEGVVGGIDSGGRIGLGSPSIIGIQLSIEVLGSIVSESSPKPSSGGTYQ